MKPEVKGPLLMVGAMFSYSAMSALVKVAGPEIPSIETVFFRAVVGMPLLYAVARRNRVSLMGNRRGLLILRGLAGAVAVNCFFFALTRIPVTDALLLNQVSAIFILPLAVLFLRERVTLKHVGFVVVALTGVGFIIKPTAQVVELGALAALGSAFFAAIALATVRKLTETENVSTVVFWFSAVMVITSVPPMIPVFVVPSPKMLAALVAMGLLATFGQMLMTQAYGYGEAGRLAVIGSMGAVFGTGWDLVLWAHLPDYLTIFGGVLVITACSGVQILRRSVTPTRPG